MPTAIAVTWYKDEATYFRFPELCVDKEQFFDSYAEWLVSAQKKVKDRQQEGLLVQKIDTDPDQFALWCRSSSRKRDGTARAAYAALQAAKMNSSRN